MTQRQALDILKTGANVFLTGAAGSGKTHVLREYLACLRERDIAVGVTASTGIAATHMGGMTIHAWSGIGVHDDLSWEQIEEIAEKDYVRRKVEAAKVLIIDEISMLHHFRLDLVNRMLKRIKKCEDAFGGLQVIVCGDFFQLPPVSRMGERESLFAYHSEAWREAGFIVCYLEEQHRQTDLRYVQVLNAIRGARVTQETVDVLKTRLVKAGVAASTIQATKLYSHNVDVDAENERELTKVEGRTFEYTMESVGNKKLIETLKKSCLAPEILKLKKGAQVMFVKNNYDQGYANGTRGIVEECLSDSIVVSTANESITVEPESWRIEDGGKVLAELRQYPLRLAWAITIHKSQGMSLDAAHIDLSKSFEDGMGYVALSRVRSLDGLSLMGLNGNALDVHPEALEYDHNFRKLSAAQSAEFSVMSAVELRNLHVAFLGPDPSSAEKDGNRKKVRGPKAPKAAKVPTVELTKKLLDTGMSIRDTAAARGVVFGTILTHIEELKAADPKWDYSHLRNTLPSSRFQKIAMAFNKVGMQEGGRRMLSPVKRILGGGYTFDELRVVRLFL